MAYVQGKQQTIVTIFYKILALITMKAILLVLGTSTSTSLVSDNNS